MSNSESPLSGRRPKTGVIVVVALLALYIIGTFTGSSSESSNQSTSLNSPSSSTAWIPSGFDSWNSEIAYKWVEDPICDTYSVCAAIQIVANKDCPNNLYAELTLQDANYVQYDYTNDSQGSLYKGNKAELTFNFQADNRFAHFEISKISCQ